MLSSTDKKEIKDIISNEFDKIVEKKIEQSLKRGIAKKEVLDLIRKAMVDYAKFVWTKRTTWANEIKGN